jgi:hypothetical protein
MHRSMIPLLSAGVAGHHEYGFNYEVQPAAPPAGPPLKGPIPLVGWREDPVQQELAKKLKQALGDEQKLNALLDQQQSLRVALPLAICGRGTCRLHCSL